MEDNRQNIPSFIGKLSLMLQDQSSSPYVSWGASGESIIVTDTSAFATAVLPRYFKHSNFASFVRQLNLYGFHKTSQESDSCEFSHQMFKQGNEHLFKDIRRKVAPCGTNSDKDASLRGAVGECGAANADAAAFMQLQIDLNELRSKHTEMEATMRHKDAEQRLFLANMLQDKHHTQALEARVSTMMMVLNKACTTLGMTQCIQELNQANTYASSVQASQSAAVSSPTDLKVEDAGLLVGGKGRLAPADSTTPASKRSRYESLEVKVGAVSLLPKGAAGGPSPTGGSSDASQGPTSVPPSPRGWSGRGESSLCEDAMVPGACSLVFKGPREDVSPTLCPIQAHSSTGSRGSRSPRSPVGARGGGGEGAGRQRSGRGTDFGDTGVTGRAEGRGRDERARSGKIENALSEDTGTRLDMDSDAMLGVHTLMMLAGRV